MIQDYSKRLEQIGDEVELLQKERDGIIQFLGPVIREAYYFDRIAHSKSQILYGSMWNHQLLDLIVQQWAPMSDAKAFIKYDPRLNLKYDYSLENFVITIEVNGSEYLMYAIGGVQLENFELHVLNKTDERADSREATRKSEDRSGEQPETGEEVVQQEQNVGTSEHSPSVDQETSS